MPKFHVNLTVEQSVPFCAPEVTVVVDAEDAELAQICVMTLMRIDVSHSITSVEPAEDN